MKQPTHSLVKLHLAVFVAGLTGLFGKLVSLSEVSLVWWRLLLTVAALVPILYFRHELKGVKGSDILKMAAAGSLLGIHWVLFYASIRLSNISIGVTCYALSGFYTALFDPLVNKRKFDFRELVFSMLTLAGLMLIFHFDTQFRAGIAVGAVSSLFAAFYTICNKYLRTRMDHVTTTFLFYEISGGWVCLSLLLPVYVLMTSGNLLSVMTPCMSDFGWLLILATVCTVGQYLLQLEALRGVSPFTVNLTYNLEPIYSILLAVIFFHESSELTTAFFCGITLIVTSVFLQNWRSRSKH